MLDYYNDFDPGAAEWLRTLMVEGHIPPGRVDGRSILDVSPDDLARVRRAHFFAGIAGWSEALRLADWPEWLPLWTGSPPCQPFSAAGKRGGRDDARHLGPRFIELVRSCRPPVLFGEQVASADVFGPATGSRKRDRQAEPAWAWIDDLFDRLEAAGYAAWALDIPAAGIGAPHIRQRCFFAAVDLRFAGGLENAELPSGERQRSVGGGDLQQQEATRPARGSVAHGLVANAGADAGLLSGRLADDINHGQRQHRLGLGVPAREGEGSAGERQRLWPDPAYGGAVGRLADAEHPKRRALDQHGQDGCDRPHYGWPEAHGISGARGEVLGRPGPTNGLWGAADWLACRDGSWRPVEPGTFPLAHGVSGRVGLLRGYGNAIVPAAAAEAIVVAREVMIEAGIWGALRAAYGPEAAE